MRDMTTVCPGQQEAWRPLQFLSYSTVSYSTVVDGEVRASRFEGALGETVWDRVRVHGLTGDTSLVEGDTVWNPPDVSCPLMLGWPPATVSKALSLPR